MVESPPIKSDNPLKTKTEGATFEEYTGLHMTPLPKKRGDIYGD